MGHIIWLIYGFSNCKVWLVSLSGCEKSVHTKFEWHKSWYMIYHMVGWIPRNGKIFILKPQLPFLRMESEKRLNFRMFTSSSYLWFFKFFVEIVIIGMVINRKIGIEPRHVKWGASSRSSFRPNSACVSKETMTFRKTHPTLWYIQNQMTDILITLTV